MHAWRALLCVLATLVSAPACADGLFYQLLSDKGSAWLLGSVHFGKADMYPLPQPIERAFAASDRLLVEVNILELERAVVSATMADLGLLPGDQRLRKHVSEQVWQRLTIASEQMGVAVEVLARQRPWLASMTLTAALIQHHGMFASDGVDQHFLRRATQSQMPVFQLEDFTQQMRLLSATTASDQVHMLEASLQQVERADDMPAQLLDAWRAADGARLQRLMFAQFNGTEQAKRLAVRLLEARNGPMAQGIVEQIARGGTVFVVLGAAHLFGAASVPEQLRQRGLTVIKH